MEQHSYSKQHSQLRSAVKSALQRPGPFASVVADISLDAADAQTQLMVTAKDVAGELINQGASEEITSAIAERIAEPVTSPAPQSRFVIADAESVFVDRVLSVETDTRLAEWSPLPDLGPVCRHSEAATDFVLVEVDHEGGQVSTYSGLGWRPEPLVRVESTGYSDEHVNKVRGGGLAHRRYQRTSENAWRNRAREVADLATEKIRAGYGLVIVAGSIKSRRDVIAELDTAQAAVIELERAGRNADSGTDELADEVLDAVAAHQADQRQERLDQTREKLGQGVAAAGYADVVDALRQAQADAVLIDWDNARQNWIDPADHTGIALTQITGQPSIRADQLIAALAMTTDAQLISTAHDELGYDAVATLRWNT